jgi:hypothetical protein
MQNTCTYYFSSWSAYFLLEVTHYRGRSFNQSGVESLMIHTFNSYYLAAKFWQLNCNEALKATIMLSIIQTTGQTPWY